MASRYPTERKGFTDYFKKLLLKNTGKTKRLYFAGKAASSRYASDSEWDELDAALSRACPGLMNFVNSEKAEEINDEMYCDVLDGVYTACRRAKITISF